MLFNPEIETMSLPGLRKIQVKRLRYLVEYLKERVPFYREKFQLMGVSPDSIKRIEDIKQLPFTFKKDLREHYPFGLLAVPENEIRRIHCSSGTTGKPTVVAYTERDLKVFSEVNARSLVAAGARPGMKLHNAYGYGLFTGGLGIHYGAEMLKLAVTPVSGGMTERQMMLIMDFKPEIISCTPSYALTLAESFARNGIKPEEISLQFAVLGAEPWTESIREDVQKGLGVKASNIYGLSEIIGPGVSQEDCDERGRGSHMWEDHFFPEIVDPDSGEPLEEGKPGLLVITTLTKEALPLIRYRTNDITSLFYDKDSKRTHIKMGPVLGRVDDMLIIRGVNLFPSQVEDVLNDVAELSSHYQLIVSREASLDHVMVKVEAEEGLYKQKLADQNGRGPEGMTDFMKKISVSFKDKCKGKIGLSFKVEVLAPGTLPRSEGGKLQHVIDERNLN